MRQILTKAFARGSNESRLGKKEEENEWIKEWNEEKSELYTVRVVAFNASAALYNHCHAEFHKALQFIFYILLLFNVYTVLTWLPNMHYEWNFTHASAE